MVGEKFQTLNKKLNKKWQNKNLNLIFKNNLY